MPKKPFRSFTDINNYNQFLLSLDKTQKEKGTDGTKETQGTKETHEESKPNSSEPNNVITQRDIEELLLSIAAEFKNSNPEYAECCNDCPDIPVRKYKCEKSEPKIALSTFHKYVPRTKTKVKTKQIEIHKDINCVADLLSIINEYPDDDETEYNIDVSSLHKIKEPLVQLDSMVGMASLKENIVDQILFYIQNLHTNSTNDFMHTVIYGPPGTGKTEIAKIMGLIFAKLGILKKGTFKKVTRSDLIAGYLGQTAIKTKEVIKEALGGVLFIDEAYALGNEEKRDSFSKECIDTLCEALSDNKDNLMVIIAGYETDLNNCFFNYNKGLQSRFTWRFKTDEYNATELKQIFEKKVSDSGWHISEPLDVKWFEKHKSDFKAYGRDIETLFAKSKIAHGRRVFCLDKESKKKLIIKDLEKGLETFLKNSETNAKEKEFNKLLLSTMYA